MSVTWRLFRGQILKNVSSPSLGLSDICQSRGLVSFVQVCEISASTTHKKDLNRNLFVFFLMKKYIYRFNRNLWLWPSFTEESISNLWRNLGGKQGIQLRTCIATVPTEIKSIVMPRSYRADISYHNSSLIHLCNYILEKVHLKSHCSLLVLDSLIQSNSGNTQQFPNRRGHFDQSPCP